jgi:multidrug efflux system membrane fusion protein
MKKSIIAILIVVALMAGGVAIWFITKPATEVQNGGAGRTDRIAKVTVVAVKPEAVPLVLDAVGTAEAEQSVAVRAEVGGILKKIYFREGDLVKAGQLLFQIDADSQQAEVEKARANLARDQAALDEAKAQAQRLQSLAAKEFVTQQEYAQAVAQEQAAAATVRASQATLKTVQLQLGNTHITAPFSGRAGILNVKQGNLVSVSSTTPLVTINAMQPVMVAFNVPQQQLQKIREQQHKSALAVEVRRNEKEVMLAQGTLAFIDNAVDMQTGTIRMKARIPNKNEAIWPGELISLRLILEVQADALVIPESALQTGQSGTFVYVMEAGKARFKPITVARQVGTQIVVASGLVAGQQVIVNPPKNLRPDSAVELAGEKNGSAPDAQGNGKERKRGKPKADSETAPGGTRP